MDRSNVVHFSFDNFPLLFCSWFLGWEQFCIKEGYFHFICPEEFLLVHKIYSLPCEMIIQGLIQGNHSCAQNKFYYLDFITEIDGTELQDLEVKKVLGFSTGLKWKVLNSLLLSFPSRHLVGSTNQACSSGLYFRIAWKSTERPLFFLQNHFLSFLQGLRLLQKLSMKSLDSKF